MKNKKKIIITSCLLVALLLMVSGITYAAFSFISNASDNTINSGQISFSYTEPSNSYIIENALPVSDSEGKNQSHYFEFSISSNAKTNSNDDLGVSIPYEISIQSISVDSGKTALDNDQIKINLVKMSDSVEEEVVAPTLISSLGDSEFVGDGKKLYKQTNEHVHNNGTITTTYRLRAWINEGVDVSNWDSDGKYQYKFKINVNANGKQQVIEDNSLANHIKTLYNTANGAADITDSGEYYLTGSDSPSTGGGYGSYEPDKMFLAYVGQMANVFLYLDEDGQVDEEKIETDIKNFIIKQTGSTSYYDEMSGSFGSYLNIFKGMIMGYINEDTGELVDDYTIDDLYNISIIDDILVDNDKIYNFLDDVMDIIYMSYSASSFNEFYLNDDNKTYNITKLENVLELGVSHFAVYNAFKEECDVNWNCEYVYSADSYQSFFDEMDTIKTNFGNLTNYFIAIANDMVDYSGGSITLEEDADLPTLEELLGSTIGAEEISPTYLTNTFIKFNDQYWQIYSINDDDTINIMYAGYLDGDYKDGYALINSGFSFQNDSSYHTDTKPTSFLDNVFAKFYGFGSDNESDSAYLKLIENSSLGDLIVKKNRTYLENDTSKTFNSYFSLISEDDFKRSMIDDGYSYLIPYSCGDYSCNIYDISFAEAYFNDDDYGFNYVYNQEHDYTYETSKTLENRIIGTIKNIKNFNGSGTLEDPYVVENNVDASDLDIATAVATLYKTGYEKDYHYEGLYELFEGSGYETYNAVRVGDKFKIGVTVNGNCYLNQNSTTTMVLAQSSDCNYSNFSDSITFSDIKAYVDGVETNNPIIAMNTDDTIVFKVDATIAGFDASDLVTFEWKYYSDWSGVDRTIVEGLNDYNKTDDEKFYAYDVTSNELTFKPVYLFWTDIMCYATYNGYTRYVGHFDNVKYVESEITNSFTEDTLLDGYVGDSFDIISSYKNVLNYEIEKDYIYLYDPLDLDDYIHIAGDDLEISELLSGDSVGDIDYTYTISPSDYHIVDPDTGISKRKEANTLVLNLYYSGFDEDSEDRIRSFEYFMYINLKPSEITSQPVSADVSKNGTATFSVSAKGAASYKWQKKVDGNWVDLSDVSGKVSGSTTSTLSITATSELPDKTTYRCVIVGSDTLYTNEVDMNIVITDGDWLYEEVLDDDDIPTGEYNVIKFIGDYNDSSYVEVEEDYFDSQWFNDEMNLTGVNNSSYMQMIPSLLLPSPEIFGNIAKDYYNLTVDSSLEEILNKALQLYNNPSLLNDITIDDYTDGEIDGYKVTLPSSYLTYDVIGATGNLFYSNVGLDGDGEQYSYSEIVELYYDNPDYEYKQKYENHITDIIVPEGIEYIGDVYDLENEINTNGLIDTIEKHVVLTGLPFVKNYDLPDTLSSIGSFAIYNISTFSIYKFMYTGETLEFTIPKNVTEIKPYTIKYVGAVSINFDEGSTCTLIDDYAFDSYTLELHVPASVEEIGSYVVNVVNSEAATTGLKVLEFENTTENPSHLKTIGSKAFYASIMTELVIPASVETIGSEAFASLEYLGVGYRRDGGPVRYLESLIFEDTAEHPSQLKNLATDAFLYNLPDGVIVPNGLTLNAN